VHLLSAIPEPYGPGLTVWCQAPTALEASTIETSISDSITTYLEFFPIGGVTAADDANPSFTGLYGTGIDGAIAAGVTAAGATLISVQGATDLALIATQVATDAITSITVRLVPVTS
jgi:hypothetical protein